MNDAPLVPRYLIEGIMLKLILLVTLLPVIYGQMNDAPLVQIQTYVMSKCPYASQWVEDFQNSVLSKEGLPLIINFTMDFIANVDNSEPTGFYSKHGQTEVQGDFNILCAQKLVSNKWTSYYPFVDCLEQQYTAIPQNVQECARKHNLDYGSIKTCVSSSDAHHLMVDSIKRTESLDWNPRPGSPTVYVDGKCVSGFNPCPDPAISGADLLHIVCDSYTGTKPSGCN
eukprot:TRINITY_DN12337_c0_g1_i1.p1 TRINITY_DN12337_c0_g1~~TRINITY_DN12337_c0_g1_i1.p1  ORF type:complete len:227 (+),score=37.01 TRINITY_DN12337_c0_g1_i1:2-682(+)